MRQVLEALRLTFDQRRSQREISLVLGVSQSTVLDEVDGSYAKPMFS